MESRVLQNGYLLEIQEVKGCWHFKVLCFDDLVLGGQGPGVFRSFGLQELLTGSLAKNVIDMIGLGGFRAEIVYAFEDTESLKQLLLQRARQMKCKPDNGLSAEECVDVLMGRVHKLHFEYKPEIFRPVAAS
jgi:hypothetical protein